MQKLESPQPGTFIGRGKADVFAERCRREEVDTVIFDDELTPAQIRNLENVFECKILDRTAVILEIFAWRARTREGKLQVELAQLEHLLPRLTRYWGHLSRQRGGLGAIGGEGESQLEADRRREPGMRSESGVHDTKPTHAQRRPSQAAGSTSRRLCLRWG